MLLFLRRLPVEFVLYHVLLKRTVSNFSVTFMKVACFSLLIISVIRHVLCALFMFFAHWLPEQRRDIKRQLICSMFLACVRALKHVSGCVSVLFIFNHLIVVVPVPLIYFILHSSHMQDVEVIIFACQLIDSIHSVLGC